MSASASASAIDQKFLGESTEKTWRTKYPRMEDQAEFFLLKFGKDDDISREAVFQLMQNFQKFAKKDAIELEEDEAMRLLESRNQTKTFKELRAMVLEIDVDQNRLLCFLEWACAIFNKSWTKLHAPSIDPEEIRKAEELAAKVAADHAKAKAAEDEARRLENEKRLQELRAKEEHARKGQDVEAAASAKKALEAELIRQSEETKSKHAREEAARLKKLADEEERRAKELSKQGVAGMAAKFKYMAKDTLDPTKENMVKIKNDAEKRRVLKQQQLEAIAKKKLADEEILKKQQEADIAQKKAREAEEAAREAATKKAAAEKEAAEKDAALKAAEEEKKKAMAGKEASMKELLIYQQKKQEQEEKERLKKEEEDRKRNEGRAKIAAKSSAWNKASTPSQVVASIPSAAPLRHNSSTSKPNTTLQQANLLRQIQSSSSTNLSHLPGAHVASEELTDDQKASFIADQMKKGRTSVAGVAGGAAAQP